MFNWLFGSRFKPGANLENAKLEKKNLAGVDLSGANLRNAKLSFANLRNANLAKADLTGAYVDDADLQGAILHNAILTETNFVRSNLRQSDLRTDISSAAFWDADLSNADMRGVKISAVFLGSRSPPNEKWRSIQVIGWGMGGAGLP